MYILSSLYGIYDFILNLFHDKISNYNYGLWYFDRIVHL